MILRGEAACEKTGIPSLHAEAFQEVAEFTKCVISSRAVGIYATGLILENYSSKGFHNKAKSCNWGPMAGFVLDDPRFTKVGNTEKGQAEQADALLHAIDEKAVEVPLFISDDRRQWLASKRLMEIIDRDSDSFTVRGTSPWGLALEFKLIRSKPEGATEKMWSVNYRKADRKSARGADGGGSGGWTPVMAMRDPLCTISAKDFHAATTGDYDLFAIWAPKDAYSPDKLDKRMISHANLEANIKAKKFAGEDEHLGNTTARLRLVRNRLNEGFLRRGYTGGNMVHHSDEGGRPFVGDIDLPIFAVVPGKKQCYALEAVPDLREFITSELDRAYAPVFSPGWMKQLVFGDKVADAKKLHAELQAKIAGRA